MKIEPKTFELGGNPPVRVQLASSAGLAPLPVPGPVSRFRAAAAMEEKAGEAEVLPVHVPSTHPSLPEAAVNAGLPASAASAATARTEVVAETVNAIVEAVADRISVTPSLAQGDGEIRITLRQTVLDGSGISISAKNGELTVIVAPATPEAAKVAAAALPRLEAALAEHAATFHHVSVAVATSKKGRSDEAA